MKKPFQGCDDKHAHLRPLARRAAAMDAADRGRTAPSPPAPGDASDWLLVDVVEAFGRRLPWLDRQLPAHPRPDGDFLGADARRAVPERPRRAGPRKLTRVVAKDIDQFHTHKAFAGHFRDHFARLDPERGLHKTPRLYAVWAEKLELLEVARRRRFFGPPTAFFWIDIGIFRGRGPDYHPARRTVVGPTPTPSPPSSRPAASR